VQLPHSPAALQLPSGQPLLLLLLLWPHHCLHLLLPLLQLQSSVEQG
jgi:hypothetical protein